MKQKLLVENAIKNLVVIFALVFSYFPISHFLGSLRIGDYSMIGITSSLLIMAFLFADYAFTYTASDLASGKERLLDHLITAIIMYGSGVLLEISTQSLNLSIQKNFTFFSFVSFLFYISLVLYDFWDLNRASKLSKNVND